MTHKRKYLFILLLILDAALIAFILTRSMKPADASDAESGGWLAVLQRIIPSLTMYAVRKLAHFTEFFVLGGLLGLTCAVRWKPMLWQPWCAAVLVACLDETIQRFVPGRSGQLTDVVLDGCGALGAVLLVWLLGRIIRKNRP